MEQNYEGLLMNGMNAKNQNAGSRNAMKSEAAPKRSKAIFSKLNLLKGN